MRNILRKIKQLLFPEKLEDAEKKIEEVHKTLPVSVEYVNEDDIEQYDEEESGLGYDEVYLATQSNDLETMLKASELETTLSNRHFLLQAIVSETYSLRKEEKYKNLCLKFSETHLEEFHLLTQKLKDDFDGSIPRVTTFQYYSTLLTELGEYEKAIKTCEMAVSYGLDDGTKAGFQGRIARIKKKMISNVKELKVDNIKNSSSITDTDLTIENNEISVVEYSIDEIRQFIREVVREAKDTAKVETGYLKRSIKGDWIARTKSVEFRQVFYGAEKGNSKLFEIATRRMPKDLKWKVILEG